MRGNFVATQSGGSLRPLCAINLLRRLTKSANKTLRRKNLRAESLQGETLMPYNVGFDCKFGFFVVDVRALEGHDEFALRTPCGRIVRVNF